ncbi:MAG: hypothetical protein K0Q55_3275, partial [Verrucomicrobia bacterium]|nr:hypothetical protein [Verrucomicrobiota bacterium]
MLASVLFSSAVMAATYQPSEIKPPAVDREFRGVWIATVSNIDWPSKKGLPAGEQQKEL